MKSKTDKEIELLKKMIYIRMVEEKISEKYSDNNMRCPVHLSIGQESSAVGVCHALEKKDRVFSNHRCHAHYLAKNGNLTKMIGELYGKEIGCCKGRGGSMHLFDNENGIPLSVPIVGSGIPLAVGSSLQSKIDKNKIVSVVFFGDGAVEEGVFHESLNFASLNKLPIIFVCENNFYSVYTKLSDRQPKRNITQLAKSHNIKFFDLKSIDALKIFQKTKELVNKCREGSGPYFINIDTYRYLAHCGPSDDDHLNYREKNEVKLWKEKDPVSLLIKKMKKNKNFFDIEKFKNSKKRYINSVFKKVELSPLPKPETINKYLYAE